MRIASWAGLANKGYIASKWSDITLESYQSAEPGLFKCPGYVSESIKAVNIDLALFFSLF